jgi:hypothetical protein
MTSQRYRPRGKAQPKVQPTTKEAAVLPMQKSESPDRAYTVEIMMIDAAKAKEFLLLNIGNRPLSRSRVKILARKMRNREWMFTGQAHVIISDLNVLINGQHTLYAVIESDTIIETIVVTGVAPEAFDRIDIGWKRTIGNILSVGGIHNASQLGSMVRIVDLYDSLTKTEKGWSTSMDLEADELVSIFETDPDNFIQAITFGKHVNAEARKTGVALSASVAGAFRYLGARQGHDPETLERFLTRVAGDVGHDTNDPALYVRRWLALRDGGTTFRSRDRALSVLSTFIKGYRSAENGKSLRRIFAWTRESPDYPRL